MKFKTLRIQRLIYGPDPDPAPTPPAPPAPTLPTPAKTYKQEDVDGIVGKTKAELQKKFDKDRASDLERMAKLETDAAEKANLEKQIEELNNRYKSKEELAQESFKKEQAKWQEEAKRVTIDRDAWKGKYETQTLLTELGSAASKKTKDYEVHNPAQLVRFLRPDARVVEKVVEGKPSGQFETRIKFQDAKGKELDLTPDEVVKLMSEMPEHHNFFKAGVVGGINGAGKQGAGNDGLLGLTQDEFNKRYREGKLPKRK